MAKIKGNINKKQGIRLSEVRKDMNITQEKLAELSNYSVQTISGIENGSRRMTLESATILAKVLRIRKEYLLCEDNYISFIEQIRHNLEANSKLFHSLENVIQSLGYIFSVNTLHYELNGKIKDDDTFMSYPMPFDDDAPKIFPEVIYDTYKLISPYDDKIVSKENYDNTKNEIMEFMEFKLQKLMKEGEPIKLHGLDQ